MKISYNWLKDYLHTDLDPEELSKLLTSIGLEVEGLEEYEEVKGGLKGFVVGEVMQCSKHPNADKLSLTKVNVGQGTLLDVVCGAPNVAAGQKVIVATVGTEIFMGDKSFTISKSKIRGEESEGMICAEDELGLGKGHEGIMVLESSAKPGTPAAEFFNIKSDTVFEIGLTPNRIDAASHMGVARDLAASLSLTKPVVLKKPETNGFKPGDNKGQIIVRVEDTQACRRYAGITIRQVKIAPSPSWMQHRLKAIGINPINNIVDITNYVLHEMGQPLHAFDADSLAGKTIVVRKAREGELFVTLDGTERKLSASDLMICDAEKPACMAGVFGGLHSGVNEATRNIFLESANFDPISVRKTARRHLLNTDSSFRFERGVDPEITTEALRRAALLIAEIAGGIIASEITDIYPTPIKPIQLRVHYSHIDRLIGKKLDHGLIKKILESLDIQVLAEKDDALDLSLPPYRVDVTREADVIEEILRIYGYNNVEFPDKISASLSPSVKPDNELMVNRISDFMAANGFNEIMSNSLTRSAYYANQKTYPAGLGVKILNPLSSDLDAMRQTLLFNGLEAINYNINRQNGNLRFFEFGRCYSLSGKTEDSNALKKYSEEQRLAIFLTGNKAEPSWFAPDQKASFYSLKAYCEKIIEKMIGQTTACKVSPLEEKEDLFQGGLQYTVNNKTLLEVGTVSPLLARQLDIDQEVHFAELRWDILLKLSGKPVHFKEMPRFPEVRRDLALLIDEQTSFSQIKDLALQTEKKLLKRINLFDFYQGKNIPQGKKSYGVSFYLQDEQKTLTDTEIERIMQKMADKMRVELGAELR
ncbi:MAG: phenylalanine--tRNA ligase subunit beta [Bacteroidota bacterium]|nr:MAG: phenylalanine--tRNA ligase subunit beta [Bacteroidota bacterium]